jgi:hypothetical protein
MAVDTMKELRERSGSFDSNDMLVSFLYELMRDHVTPGQVEAIMLNVKPTECQFTNGYLARYAADVAERLKRK